jgi:futalosine hydrolase
MPARHHRFDNAPDLDACDVLLLAAFAPELEPLAADLGEGLRGRVGVHDVAARTIGIGLPRAAVGAANHIADLRPRTVLAIGTCGAYAVRPGDPPLAIGDVVVGRRIRLVDRSVVAGAAQFPGAMSLEIGAHAALAEGLTQAGARPVDVATTLAIAVDDASAPDGTSPDRGRATVEHLEAFGVGEACASHGVAFAVLFGVANRVGPSAREEWRTHHRAAAAAAVSHVLRWLRASAVLG